jgi:hypothetical protein
MKAMFTTLFTETDPLDDVLDAWASAAHDSRVAWDTWLASPARDREERAAEALAASMATRQRRVASRPRRPQ